MSPSFKNFMITDTANTLIVTKGERWVRGGIIQEFGVNIYTLLYIKYTTHKDLLYSAGNYTQYFDMTLSGGFLNQEYWSGLPFPSPGDLPDPGIEPRSPALESDALTSAALGSKKKN